MHERGVALRRAARGGRRGPQPPERIVGRRHAATTEPSSVVVHRLRRAEHRDSVDELPAHLRVVVEDAEHRPRRLDVVDRPRPARGTHAPARRRRRAAAGAARSRRRPRSAARDREFRARRDPRTVHGPRRGRSRGAGVAAASGGAAIDGTRPGAKSRSRGRRGRAEGRCPRVPARPLRPAPGTPSGTGCPAEVSDWFAASRIRTISRPRRACERGPCRSRSRARSPAAPGRAARRLEARGDHVAGAVGEPVLAEVAAARRSRGRGRRCGPSRRPRCPRTGPCACCRRRPSGAPCAAPARRAGRWPGCRPRSAG